MVKSKIIGDWGSNSVYNDINIIIGRSIGPIL